jgi:hypothetical protein
MGNIELKLIVIGLVGLTGWFFTGHVLFSALAIAPVLIGSAIGILKSLR